MSLVPSSPGVSHWFPTQAPTCSVTAWMQPGHGFVEFNCGNRTSSIGFYPGPFIPEQRTITERTESACELALKKGNDYLRHQYVDLVRLGEIVGQKKQHRLDNLPEAIPLLRAIGVVVGSSSKTGYSQSVMAAYEELPSSGSLSVGWSTTTGSHTKIFVDEQRRGWVRKDACALLDCVNGNLPCMTSRIETTPDKVEKAWQEMVSTREELAVDDSKQCASGEFHKSTYQMWSNNCLIFMKRVMDATGATDWQQKMTYTSSPGAIGAGAIAWHYFNYIMKD